MLAVRDLEERRRHAREELSRPRLSRFPSIPPMISPGCNKPLQWYQRCILG